MEANTYEFGVKVKITGTFKKDGVLVDPLTVRVIYEPPSGTTVTKTYPTDPEIKKDSPGIYSIELFTSIAGYWYYRMDDGGDNVGEEGAFVVKSSNLI